MNLHGMKEYKHVRWACFVIEYYSLAIVNPVFFLVSNIRKKNLLPFAFYLRDISVKIFCSFGLDLFREWK